jgi:hypothetical protein
MAAGVVSRCRRAGWWCSSRCSRSGSSVRTGASAASRACGGPARSPITSVTSPGWNVHLIALGITAIAPTSGASRRWTPPGCGPPSSPPSSLLEDSLTGDWMRALIQMAADAGKGVYRRQRGLPGVLQAPLAPGLGYPRNACHLHLADPSPAWSPRGTLRSAGRSSVSRAGVGRGSLCGWCAFTGSASSWTASRRC